MEHSQLSQSACCKSASEANCSNSNKSSATLSKQSRRVAKRGRKIKEKQLSVSSKPSSEKKQIVSASRLTFNTSKLFNPLQGYSAHHSNLIENPETTGFQTERQEDLLREIS